jgi:hypothetical protein
MNLLQSIAPERLGDPATARCRARIAWPVLELIEPWIAFNINIFLAGIIFAVVLSAAILVLLEIGRRIGVRQLAEEGENASKGLGATEGAIFGLLGLILAF